MKETESYLIKTNGWMWYWYTQNKAWERQDSVKQSIIDEYAYQTKVSARSAEDLRAQMKVNHEANDQVITGLQGSLSIANTERDSEIRKKKVWKGITFVGIPVAFGGGVLLTAYILK